MTVEELIIKLQECNPNAEIIAESPYRDRFKVKDVIQSDCEKVVWVTP
jgi:hypothetical protein